MEGVKHDQTKTRWSLMPWAELEEVAKVMTHGAEKYAPDNWKKLDPERLEDALLRHITDWCKGEKTDPDTGFSHLSHAACNVLFLMWHDRQLPPFDPEEVLCRSDKSYQTEL